MIINMKFLTISGPRSSIDRVCEEYLSKYEMQIENAVTELKTTKNIMPFTEINPYREPLEKAVLFEKLIPGTGYEADASMDKEEMGDFLREINHDYLEFVEKREQVKRRRDELSEVINVISPFCAIDADIGNLNEYRFLKVRFGRILSDYYLRLQKYLFEDLNAIFVEGTKIGNYVYGCYFAAKTDAPRVDAAFSSLHFDRIELPSGYEGKPADICARLKVEMEEAKENIEKCGEDINNLMKKNASRIIGCHGKLEELSLRFDIRKNAARIHSDDEDSFILCGWMSERETNCLLEDTKNDDEVFVMVEDNSQNYFGKPPTKLKNPVLFQPFEMLVRMYGLPNSGEIDPTVFVAMTYVVIFGAMFGDLGQGLCLFLLGGIVYMKKRNHLAGIISAAGLSSAVFGVMFGSLFGFEDIIEARWLRPVDAMSTLPFIGQLNTVFVIAVCFGMIINLMVMLFNVVNAIRAHNKGELMFSHNGLAGMVFYGFLVVTIILYMSGRRTPGNLMMVIFLGVPVILFLFKEPLERLVSKRHEKMEGSKGMFLVQALFELFETMLSYFSNTVSFVRIGAFAVSHAAMMNVVLMLSGAEGGHINWVGVVMGNVVVCLLEGLIVGIQVLRLEYYEMFSRFYTGGGREFQPNNQVKKK